MIELPSLYDHQSGQIDDIRVPIRTETHRLNLNGKDEKPDYVYVRSVILQASPGAGKTRMAKWILTNFLNKTDGKKCLFAVHRRNLVINASDSFNKVFRKDSVSESRLPHGVVMSGNKTDWKNDCYVASIDSLNSWWIEKGKYRETSDVFDVCIHDEVHFHLSKHLKWVKAHERRRRELGLDPAIYIGLTATPANKQLHELFSTIVHGKSTQWLIDKKFLVPFRYYSGSQGNTSVLKKSGGKMGFTDQSVVEAMDGMAGELVRDWEEFGDNQPTVGFFTTLSEAKEASEMLEDAGIPTAYLDGGTSDEERADIFEKMATGEIKYTCNVGVIEIGTNIPEVACIQLCTKVGSRKRLEQILGRGSRPSAGKTHCIVIDHLGNIAGPDGHGWFEDEWKWSIQQAEPVATGEEAGRPIVACPQCSIEYRGGKCNACGYQPTPKELKPQGLAFSGTDMQEIIRPEKKKKEPKKQSMEKIMIGALYKASYRNGTWGSACAIARTKAESQGQEFKVPASFEVAGLKYKSISYGSPDSKRRVSDVYEFLGRNR